MHTSGELGRVLNEELKLMEEWVTVNKLVLNIEKTKCITFVKIFIKSRTNFTLNYRRYRY